MKPAPYDRDFHAWALETAAALREGRLSEVDIEHVAEELETMGRSEKRELASRLNVLVLHLLKYAYQPERRCGSWRGSIAEQRHRIEDLLEDSPSLRTALPDLLAREYPSAREKALLETALLDLPEGCPFTLDEILSKEFWPL
jgi:hypothetical protein